MMDIPEKAVITCSLITPVYLEGQSSSTNLDLQVQDLVIHDIFLLGYACRLSVAIQEIDNYVLIQNVKAWRQTHIHTT